MLGNRHRLVRERAVDAIAHAHAAPIRLDMDIRRAAADGLHDDGVRDADDGEMSRQASSLPSPFWRRLLHISAIILPMSPIMLVGGACAAIRWA